MDTKTSGWINILLVIALLLVITLLSWPAGSEAGKGHEDCSSCHGVHIGKGLRLFPREFNNKTINPNTNQPLAKTDSFCMTCHAPKPEGAGIRKLDLEKKHYFGGRASLVNLPETTKGFHGADKDLLTCRGDS